PNSLGCRAILQLACTFGKYMAAVRRSPKNAV
ncbi:putative transcriptional activator CadC, partial [Vibrio parahaemolyticus V-223/04]